MGRIFKKNKFKINDTAKKRPVLSCRTKGQSPISIHPHNHYHSHPHTTRIKVLVHENDKEGAAKNVFLVHENDTEGAACI